MNNEINAESTRSVNRWNSPENISYSSGGERITGRLGNHWSDYEGVDSDGDGVGDAGFSFEVGQDDYPLMEQWSDLIKA
jgi:nitrous oxidase accessory protein NosD